MKPPNLNTLPIAVEHDSQPLRDYSLLSPSGIHVLFRNLEAELIQRIRSADLVVGCVAWLTSETLLAALAEVPKGVMIVVQKEDFLRPDLDAGSDWRRRLRMRYEALRQPYERYQWPGLVGNLSICIDSTLQSVRCLGNHNRDKKPAWPRMHHKFLIFCNCSYNDDDRGLVVEPRAVWTGSFNLTHNATNSFENAVVLSEPEIVRAYYQEWEQLVALSEPLDWQTDWCAPEWRIGT